MLLKIATLLVIAIIGLLIYAATKPGAFHVERSVSIKAPPEKIFALINNLPNWRTWSPYEKLDTSMKKTLSGPESGKGATYAWEGNAQAGAGSMTITDSTPSSEIDIDLHMIKPFEGHNGVQFRLVPKVDGTEVTWAMDGKYAYMVKVMGVFMNMDKMVGGQFDEGLANLKHVAEQ